jgi:alpha-tubulin suppressor-like RCC1 family protein
MLRLRTISLAAALVACRAATPAVSVRAPLAPPAPAPAHVTPSEALPEVVSVAAGFGATCTLHRDGTVWCWGSNDHGALGDGTRHSRAEAQPVPGLAGVTQLVVASWTVCAVTGDGQVFRWGQPLDQPSHELPQDAVLAPAPLSFGAPVAEVAVTPSGICARLQRGGVKCLGAIAPDHVAGELEPLRAAVSLVATTTAMCGRLPDGALRCVSATGAVVDVPEAQGATAVVSAGEVVAMLQADGAVTRAIPWTPGGSFGGRPVAIEEARGATALWGGIDGWCFARADRLWCQGRTGDFAIGGHGVAAREPVSLPVSGLRGVRSASVGYQFACALVEGDDAPRCWGALFESVRGEERRFESLVPPGGSALTEVADVVTRGSQSCALLAHEPPRCWGDNNERAVLGAARLWSGLPMTRAEFGAPVESMAWRRDVGCAVVQGAVRCVVAEGRYTRERGERVLTPDRVVTPSLPAAARSLAFAQGAVCAALVDGRVACAPAQVFRSTRLEPVPAAAPDFVLLPELAEVSRVVALGELLCALSDTRPARCWGDAPEWDLLPTHTDTPVALPQLGPIRSLAAGEGHACAADMAGAAWCWGRGRAGQLGSGVFSERPRPTRVPLEGEVREVAVGRAHSCARVGGAVWCWGANDHGQLGDGTNVTRTAPVRVAGVEGATRVVADGDRTCAVSGDGRVHCWGAGGGHALGNGEGRDRREPTAVRGE